MNRNKIVILLAFIFSFASCDMLEVDVRSEISGSAYWKSENDFQPYLYGIYRNIRTHTNGSFGFAEDRSEMWEAGSNNRFSSSWNQDISPVKTSDWSTFYSTIGHCNLLLHQIEQFDFANEDFKNKVSAETYALRAYVYFLIAKIWGDVPLVLKPIFSENEPLHARAKVEDVFVQINSDLQKSLSLFKDSSYPDKYMVSKNAVYAILADVKMWEATVLDKGTTAFEEAIAAITEIEKSGLSLLPDYGEVFDKDKNAEIIWSLYLDRAEYTSGKYNEAFLRYDTGAGADNAETQGGSDDVTKIPMALAAQQAYCLSESALALFEQYKDTDKRILRTYIPELVGGVAERYWPNKFRGTKYSDTRVADSDMIIYRYSDILLLKAEAYACMDNSTKAIEYLDKVRTRAGITLYSTLYDGNIKNLRKEILDERGRELFHEIKRWWDLRRAHAVETIDVFTYIPNYVGKDTPLYWAVHVNVRTKNDQIDQTVGY